MSDADHYIQVVTPFSDGFVWFWKANRNGYTRRLKEAGLYTKDAAETQQGERPGVDFARPVKDMELLAVSVVILDDLDKARSIAMSTTDIGNIGTVLTGNFAAQVIHVDRHDKPLCGVSAEGAFMAEPGSVLTPSFRWCGSCLSILDEE